MTSNMAARKYLRWINFCVDIGWRKDEIPALADLWWKYHDEETGDIRVAGSLPVAKKESL